MELEWNDAEWEDPPKNCLIWIFIGENTVTLGRIMNTDDNWLFAPILHPTVPVEVEKIQAWAAFIIPPKPRRVWVT